MIECVLAEQLLAIELIDGNQSGDHRFGWRCLGVSNGLLENYALCGLMNGDVSQPDLFLALGVADAVQCSIKMNLICNTKTAGYTSCISKADEAIADIQGENYE